MTLTLELTEREESALRARAEAARLPAEELAHELLSRALDLPIGEQTEQIPVRATSDEDDELIPRDDWERDLWALGEGSEALPPLPPDAFSRESIYGPR